MKGLNKCFGLSFLLFTMLGLSLSVSSDTNAKMYPIQSIDFSNDTTEFDKVHDTYTDSDVYISYEKSHNFSISLPTDSIPDGFQFPQTWQWSGMWDASHHTCFVYRPNDGVSRYDNAGTGVSVFHINLLDGPSFSLYSAVGDRSPIDWQQVYSGNQVSNYFRNAVCQIYNYPYVTPDHENPGIFQYMPKYDFSELNNIGIGNHQDKYLGSKPYFYSFNNMGIIYQYRETEDSEVVTYDRLTSSDIFGVNVNSFNDMTISLSNMFSSPNVDPSPDPEITEDVYNFTISGRLEFYGPYSLGQYAGIKMLITDYNDDNFSSQSVQSESIHNHTVFFPDGVDITKNCQASAIHTDAVAFAQNTVDFTCHYDPSVDGGLSDLIDFDKLSIQIRFTGDSTSEDALPWHQYPFLESSTYGFSFTDFRVITNGDDTPAGYSSMPAGTGGNTTLQPGHNNTNDPSSTIPGLSINDLFQFNFLNPFNGIFNLFRDNSSCVHIPIIAGMLNSSEEYYCPWFDSSTRNVLTPVFGVVGTMLVFGYLIRWLSSSSGNFFEDSKREEVSNAGGKWGHFKKGGR